MALLLKPGVLPFEDGVSVRPEILLALMIADSVWGRSNVRECVVTSLLDGTHSPNSLHLKGLAADLRTKGTGLASRLADDLRRNLPEGYDVVLEDKDGPNEHIHVEWDPL